MSKLMLICMYQLKCFDFYFLGISIVLHFGKDQPREHVSAIVVTVINKLPDAISDYELKAVVPKGCKV